jgi:hypothetical protein
LESYVPLLSKNILSYAAAKSNVPGLFLPKKDSDAPTVAGTSEERDYFIIKKGDGNNWNKNV